MLNHSILGEDYVAERELAKLLHKHPRTIRRWRELGDGPAYVLLGDSIYYRGSALRDWLQKKEVTRKGPAGRARRAA